MAINTFAEHDQPDHERDDPILQTQANAALERWLQDHPAVAGDIKETVRIHIHLQELQGRTREAEKAVQEAEHRHASLATRLDPAGYRILGFAVGAALVVVLVVLDAIPLNWAAQAFGLDSAGTWLVTFILVVASVGAMLGFEVTRGHARRRGILAAVVTAGYLALLGLRTEFLTTVAAESFLVAVLQAAMLTAISAGLVLCGSAVMARTQVAQPVSRPRRGAACAPGRCRGPRRAEPGRREAPASYRRTAPAAPPVGSWLGDPGRCRPRPVGSRAGAGHPCPVPGVVIGEDSPLPADTKSLPPCASQSPGRRCGVVVMSDLTPSYEPEAGQVILEGLPAGAGGEARLVPVAGLEPSL